MVKLFHTITIHVIIDKQKKKRERERFSRFREEAKLQKNVNKWRGFTVIGVFAKTEE